MSDFIEDFYFGNIEPMECTTELTVKVKKSLSELSCKEEQKIGNKLTAKCLSMPASVKIFSISFIVFSSFVRITHAENSNSSYNT